jgi:hypothetical protein
MKEEDLKMISEMMESVIAAQRQELRQFKEEVIGKFDQVIGTAEDHLQHKLDLVVEGQQMLAESMERQGQELKTCLDRFDGRVTAIAVDLAAHRRDTEAHPKSWRVREEEGGE